MLTALRLPFCFDPDLLHRDLAAVTAGDWSPHYNAFDYGGQWRGAALRSASGSTRDLNSMPPRGGDFLDTPLLERCPYFREVIAAFPCPLRTVRLLGLAPGSFIREHVDDALDFEDGLVRIHVPVQTNPAVEFYLSGERLPLEEGSAYYLNVNLRHRVNNRGAAERIHLVIDAEVDDWVRDLFARSEDAPRCAPPEGGVAEFQPAALADPAIREALRGIQNRNDFAAAVVRFGRDAGFSFHEGDVDAFLRGPAVAGVPGGLPVALTVREERAYAEWIDIGDRSLAEPFFDDTVWGAMRHPYAGFSRRVAPLVDPPGACAPRGLIFHLSRCGSTLVAQMLAAADYRVISEAPPVDQAVRTGNAEWLRSIVLALGGGVPYFVKLDSWHVHSLPLFRTAFPHTPWIFLYRDPVEVLVSHQRLPGPASFPGLMDPTVLGLPAAAAKLSRDEWCAQVIAAALRAASAARDGLFVDYCELPAAVSGPIARHFGIAVDEAAMRNVAARDAKNPSMLFQPDSAAKQAEGSGLAELAIRSGLTKLYAELRTPSIGGASNC